MKIALKRRPQQVRTAICQLAEYFLVLKPDTKGHPTEQVIALPVSEWERVSE